jgi:adenylate cyclase
LREYLTKMSDLIIEERGFINKYEWDAILALWWVFWNDLDLSYRACISAIKQQRLLTELNKRWKETWFEEIKIKIWIHIWNAIIWNIWSKGKKIEFTALWDNVNLASRLEWVNKYYNTTICVSEDIYNNTKDLFEFRYLDKIKVKWKKIIVNIYELLEEKWKISEMKKDIILKFWVAVWMYLNRDFENAMNIFINLEKYQDWPSSAYIDRCEKYISNPPDEDWDWSWTMEEK